MKYVDSPASAIRVAMDSFVFSCFLRNRINQGKITPEMLGEEIDVDPGSMDAGRWGLRLRKVFTQEELKVAATNGMVMALGTTAVATNTALEAIFKKARHDDATELGQARAIMYQTRCAFAHDPLNPQWTVTNQEFRRVYQVTVQVPKVSGETVSRQIEIDLKKLNGQHLAGEDFGSLSGYFGLLHYCLEQVERHSKGIAATAQG